MALIVCEQSWKERLRRVSYPIAVLIGIESWGVRCLARSLLSAATSCRRDCACIPRFNTLGALALFVQHLLHGNGFSLGEQFPSERKNLLSAPVVIFINQ